MKARIPFFKSLDLARCAVTSAPLVFAALAAQDLSAQLTINVSSMTQLRAAITTVNASTTNDTINIAAGTYVISGAAGDDANASGDLDVDKGAGTLTINGAGATSTILDGNDTDRVLHIISTSSVTINDLTIRDGFTQDDGGLSGPAEGGGIRLQSSDLTLVDCVLDSNEARGLNGFVGANGTAGSPVGADGTTGDAANGGAIYVSGSSDLTISNCDFTGNSATGGNGGNGGAGFAPTGAGNAGAGGDGGDGAPAGAGAIYFGGGGTLAILDSLFENNTADGGTAGGGGAGGNDAAGTGDNGANGGTGAAGGAGSGGAILAFTGNLTLVSTTIRANVANGQPGGAGGAGGAGYNLDGAGGAGGVGGNGTAGGIAVLNGTLSITRCTLNNNSATGGVGGAGGDCVGTTASTAGNGGDGANGGSGRGGAVFASGSSLTIVCATFYTNAITGGNGGGGGDGGDPFAVTQPAGDGGDAGTGGVCNGGAIEVSMASTMTIRNTTIAGHSATAAFGGVGGLAGNGAGATNGLNGANTGSIGGGIMASLTASSITIDSSIIADNSASTSPDIDPAVNMGSSLVETTPTGTITLTGTGVNIIGSDPGLGALGNYGGPTQTLRIAATSVVRNAGSNPLTLTTDQRGQARDDGAGVDMGALEFINGLDDVSGGGGDDGGGDEGGCTTGGSRGPWWLLGALVAPLALLLRRLRQT